MSNELKKAKYTPLAEEEKIAGSLTVLLRYMSNTGTERKNLVRKIGDVAEDASRSIWRWSSIKEWGKDKAR